jgi:glycosyltransferase involved in cell wall biosynthesis
MERKLRFKRILFTRLPWALRHTQAYRDWAAASGVKVPAATDFRHPRLISLSRSLSARTYVPRLDAAAPTDVPVRLVAFYLPQFHRIPENDAWWGEGFTEWTKVRPSLPLFKGHEQPHVPGELGYYCLEGTEVFKEQIELAQLYGVGAFCFYMYWFAGKRLLEAPLENYLSDESLNFPFCLCWANENWSRRWDGLDQELLISQDHSPEDDLAFIANTARFMRDPRYVRIAGKPLLLIYRPSLLPSAKETSIRWRQWCRDNGIGEIYLAYSQSFDTVPPERFGFDAAIEFPPNNSSPPVISDLVEPIANHDVPVVYDWSIFPERSRHYTDSGYTLFRGVCPSWDNTARKSSRGAVFLNSSPQDYMEWLSHAVEDSCSRNHDPDQRLVFVNAWNEWAEGAHLEPDLRYGYAYLQATRNALTKESYVPDGINRIVLVSHDAHPHGAQYLALNLARTLHRSMKCEVHLICLGAGPLKIAFAETTHFYDMEGKDPNGPEAQELADRLFAMGARSAIVNTTVSGAIVATLSAAGIRCIALIHELKNVLEQYALQPQARAIATHATHIVCPASAVADSFLEFAQAEDRGIHIRPQGLYKRADVSRPLESRRTELRELLGIPSESLVVLGVGYADSRKGVDLFVQAALISVESNARSHWVWIGHWEDGMRRTVGALLDEAPALRHHVHFPGLQQDTDPFYLGADAFALTSREDPFPSVILEAFDAGVPVVGFEGAGGFTELAKSGALRLVSYCDSSALAHAVDELIQPGQIRDSMRANGRQLIDERFSFRSYARDLLDMMNIRIPRISVVIPNFNYERYLELRLRSVIDQTVPIHEVIFLDDCSSDGSIQLASTILAAAGLDYKIVRNEMNSGSVFEQWRKGIELATGDYVWIAEADDDSESDFLRVALRGFSTPGTIMSYCESQMIDAAGTRLASNYNEYVSVVDDRHWLSHFAQNGVDEVRQYMSIMNTIPNVSAVLFKREPLHEVIRESFTDISAFKVAGDWRLYVAMLEKGGVSFNPTALNRHRRHDRGVTLGERMDRLTEEISRMQELIATRFNVAPETRVKARNYLESLTQRDR